jgi:16S rRNA (guanine966-N2)-methyltransferase
VHFVEKDFNVSRVLKENILSLQADEFCKVFKMDAVMFTKLEEHAKYNLILADPPFFKDDIYKVVENVISKNFLEVNGLMLVERSVQTKENDLQNFKCEPFKKLGDSLIYQFTY